jgi:hypothetical protein
MFTKLRLWFNFVGLMVVCVVPDLGKTLTRFTSTLEILETFIFEAFDSEIRCSL